MSFIHVKNVNFDYATHHTLRNINFDIAQGSVTALVGPNGAGKTTLLRCLSSLETPMTGHVSIDGIDVHDKPREAHKIIGYLSDFFGVYNNLTVRQCLTYMAWCQKISTNNLKNTIEALAEEVDVAHYLDKKAGTLSRGYRQRLGVGLALVHSPQCLLLDEPASGMDPEARIRFSELILRLRNRGITIIVSSHILAELEDYCTDMLVIRDGEIKSHVILSEHQEHERITLNLAIHSPTEDHLTFIKNHDNVMDMKVIGDHIALSFQGKHTDQQQFLKELITHEIPVYHFTQTQKTLKAAYMDLANAKEETAK